SLVRQLHRGRGQAVAAGLERRIRSSRRTHRHFREIEVVQQCPALLKSALGGPTATSMESSFFNDLRLKNKKRDSRFRGNDARSERSLFRGEVAGFGAIMLFGIIA